MAEHGAMFWELLEETSLEELRERVRYPHDVAEELLSSKAAILRLLDAEIARSPRSAAEEGVGRESEQRRARTAEVRQN